MRNRLREARIKRGVTLYELSEMTGFSTKLLSRFEDGLIELEDKDLENLAHAVGASVEYLRGESDYLPELIRVVIFFTGSQKDKRYTIAYIDKELYKNLENVESGFLKLFWHDGNLKGYANVKEILYINEDETADEVGSESESNTWQLEEEPS